MPSSLPTFRTALKAVLEGNAVLTAANLKVYKYLNPTAQGDQWIEFTRADLVQEYLAQNKRKEVYDLRVNVWNLIPGADDEKAAEAETNVLAWADEIAAEIKADKTMAATVTHCEWVGGQVDNQLNDRGRWCLYVGKLTVKAFGV